MAIDQQLYKRLRTTLNSCGLNRDERLKQSEELLFLIENPDYQFKPVDIETFINDPHYLNLDQYCWPEVKKELIEFYRGNYSEAVLDKAIGGGKSFWASIAATYEAYRILCFKDPVKQFKLAPKSKIAFMNMSLNATNARDVVFGDILARIEDSPWFKINAPHNPRKRSVIEFTAKSVYIIPGNSKETFPSGYNIFSAIIDEAAWYIEKKNAQGKYISKAEEIYSAMKRRITSRFGLFGKIIIVSNPRYVDDFIEKKMKEAESDPAIYSSRKTLWDMKPGLKDLTFVKVTYGTVQYSIPEIFLKDFNINPELFMRDFMAVPVQALEPYIKDWAAIEAAYKTVKVRNIWKQGYLLTDEGDRYGGPCFLHVDLALNKDAAGVAMVTRYKNLVIAPLLARIQGSQKKEVQFDQIREMIYTLKRKGFNIRKISFDGWQSIDSIQQLKKKGFDVEVLSIDRTLGPYDTMKGLFNEGRLKIPTFQPLLDELQRLELVEGRKVDHPKNSSKDVADALAGACYWAAGDEYNSPAVYSPTMIGKKTGAKADIKDDDEVLIIN